MISTAPPDYEAVVLPPWILEQSPAGSSTKVRYIAEAVVRAAAPKATIRYTGGSRGWIGDVPRFNYSTAKVQKLGWSAKLTSNEAIDLAIRENLEGHPEG